MPGSLNSGVTGSFPLAPAESGVPADMVLQHVTVFFTDAAGPRWRRDGTGGLRRGVLMPSGEWRGTDRQDPVITPSRVNDSPVDPGRAPSRAVLADADRSLRRRPLRPWRVGVAIALAAVLVLVAVALLR